MAPRPTGQVIERERDGGRRVYAIRFRAYGKRRYVTLGASTDDPPWSRARAEQELANVLADVRRGIWRDSVPEPVEAPTEEPDFHAFASEWMEAKRPELRPRSAEDYEWALTHHLLPFFARHRLGEITVREVDRYKAWKLREGKLAPATVNKTLTRLAQVLEVGVEYDLIPANPAKGRRRRVRAAAPRRTWLEPEQVRPLLDAVVLVRRGGKTVPDRRTRAAVATGICAGLRVGELLRLRWRDADLAGGRLTVRAAKTDAGVRVVDLWPELQAELAAWKAVARHAGADDPVFATASGRVDGRTNLAKRLRRAIARANEGLAEAELAPIAEVTPHSLRRTYASLLPLRGEDPAYIMDQLGHTDPKLALRMYTKAMRRPERVAGMRLVGVLGGVEWAPSGTRGAETTGGWEAALRAAQEKTPR